VLLAAAWLLEELRLRAMAVFVLLWVAGYVWAWFVPYPTLFVSYVAVLDIVLALIALRGDVRLR